MPLATLSKIRDLARDGATVVWAGRPPRQCPGLTGSPGCGAELRAIAKDLWQSERLITLPKHDYARLVPILEASPHPPAWQIAGDPPLRLVHRRTREADIFFVVNRATRPVDVPVVFRTVDRSCELWDPDTGEIKPAACRDTDEGVSRGILCPGENHLEIRVANLWHNRLVGDAALPASQRITRMVPQTHDARLRGAPLVPSGLLGPVRIVFTERTGETPKH